MNSVKNPGIILPETTFLFDKRSSFEDYLNNDESVKMYKKLIDIPLQIKESTLDELDSRNRKFLKGSFQLEVEKKIIALAHNNLVVPAYLIDVEENTDVLDIVEHILYNKSCTNQKTNKENMSNFSECSLTSVRKQL